MTANDHHATDATAVLHPGALFNLDGRVAVVTGASSGIGLRMAQVLHAAGAHVVLAARRLDRLTQEAEGHDRLHAVQCDVTDETDRERLVAAALAITGNVDVLVNNAGVGYVGPAEHEPLHKFMQVLDVNLVSLFALSQLVARPMLERRSGSIINVSSVMGLVGSGNVKQASYCASKGAVVNLTRELALQWARKGVRVNSIAPGWFDTEMTGVMFEDDASMGFINRNTPMSRAGELHELDGAVLFLASDASSFVTGQTLAVDGGWTIR